MIICKACRDSSVNDVSTLHNCGAKGNRTPDLFVANEALYQLSYSPSITMILLPWAFEDQMKASAGLEKFRTPSKE